MPKLASSILMLIISNIPSQDKDPAFLENSTLKSGTYKGHAVLRISQPSIARGVDFKVQIEFHNASGGDHFFNVFLNRLIPLPAQLAIFDSERKYIGDLLSREEVSQKYVSPSDWTYIPGGGYVGTELGLTGGNIMSGKFRERVHLLEAGTYYIQMVFYNVFITPSPDRIIGEMVDFYKSFDKRELFRSNVVEVRLVDI